MTCMKKLTALLVSAALAVSLLAACGSKALSSVMADLLTGLYDNVSVEVDNDLTAALKKAVSAGGTQEEILAALVENLNLSGVSIAFSSLGSGQQGEHGVTLTFQTGNDPDAAARIALAQWASVFGSLPDNGSYSASVAMIEAENGYYIAVDVEVLRAGSSGKDDEDDEPDEPYTKNKDGSYTVNTSDGLQKLFNDESKTFDENTVIELKTDTTYTVAGAQHLADTFKGTLKSADENNKASITLSGTAGLFGTLEDGKVENLSVAIEGTISTGTNYSSFACVGAVANVNSGGTIAGCEVTVDTSGSISSPYIAGGIVGYNNDSGSISNCTVIVNTANGITAIGNADNNSAQAGGIAGYNESGCTINGCTVILNAGSSITATSDTGAQAGGIAGSNDGTIDADCTVTLNTGSSISATATVPASAYAGGIAGQSNGNVSCGPATGTGTINATASSNSATVPIDENGTHNAKQDGNASAGTTCGMTTNGEPQ